MSNTFSFRSVNENTLSALTEHPVLWWKKLTSKQTQNIHNYKLLNAMKKLNGHYS